MKKFRRTNTAILTHAAAVPEKKTKKIWAIVVIIVMAMSVVGLLTIDYSTLEKYNGFKLLNVDQQSWKVLKIPDIIFYSHPTEVDSVPVTEEFMARLKTSPIVYLASPPDDANNETINAVVYDLIWPFVQQDRFLRPASTTLVPDRSQADCANATAGVPVVVLQTGVNLTLEQKGNCFVFTGENQRDFVQLRDRILYGIYNVIPDAGDDS